MGTGHRGVYLRKEGFCEWWFRIEAMLHTTVVSEREGSGIHGQRGTFEGWEFGSYSFVLTAGTRPTAVIRREYD